MPSIVAKFKLFKDCKGSRRFRTDDEDFPIRDVYVKRPWADSKLELTIRLEDSMWQDMIDDSDKSQPT